MTSYSKIKPTTFEYNGKWIKNWFSNLEPVKIEIDGITWPSVENYYQAMKSADPDTQFRFSQLSPQRAKVMGKQVIVRKDWEDHKLMVMQVALQAKFRLPEWRVKLLATGDEHIVEWNNWSDRFWGVDIRDNKGQNMLGELLMKIREFFKLQDKNTQNLLDALDDESNFIGEDH